MLIYESHATTPEDWKFIPIRNVIATMHYSKLTVVVNTLNALTARSQLY
jgi:dynein heavy chain